MRVALLAVLVAACLSHSTWFVRAMDEAELAQAEAAEVGSLVLVAETDSD
jgi:hypothetical protein